MRGHSTLTGRRTGGKAGSAILIVLGTLGCQGSPPRADVPTAGEVQALIAQGAGANVAVTDSSAGDPVLHPRTLPGAVPAVAARVEAAIATLPRWRLEGAAVGVIWVTRATRVFRFVDDVYILLQSADPAGDSTRLEARSASRLGRKDFGQNRRNLEELLRALEDKK